MRRMWSSRPARLAAMIASAKVLVFTAMDNLLMVIA
jgi:hypothetical protein